MDAEMFLSEIFLSPLFFPSLFALQDFPFIFYAVIGDLDCDVLKTEMKKTPKTTDSKEKKILRKGKPTNKINVQTF